MKRAIMVLLCLSLLVIAGCTKAEPARVEISNTAQGSTNTFQETGDDLCTQDGKPVIRKFSTSWCPHCQWIKGTYESVVNEYVAEGKIVAYQWELDTKDDLLTAEVEGDVPITELAVFEHYNPQKSIPTFIFGCRYMRVGNGYETQGDLEAEEKEFRKIIDELISAQHN